MTAPYTSAEIISLTNVVRQSEGLPPLHPDPLLTQAAQNKANAMIVAGSWSHNTPNATSWQFLDEVGYHYRVAGENLARNFDDPRQVIQGWLNSPSHKNNLLNQNYTHIGVAVATGSADMDTSILVVQYLGTPSQQVSSQSQFNPTDIISFDPWPYSTWFFILIPFLIVIILKKFQHKKKKIKTGLPQAKHWHN